MQFSMRNAFLGFFGRALVKPFILAGLGISMLLGSYHLLGPANESLGFMRRNLAERVCTEAVGDLPKREGVPSIAVLDLTGDQQSFITKLLREKIAASGEFRVLDETFFHKLLREFGKDHEFSARLEDAVATARQIGVDLIVFGEIPEFTAKDDAATLKLELRMAERASGQAIFAHSYSESIGGSLVLSAYWRARIADSSKGRRMFIWIAFTLLLPLGTIPLIRRLTAQDSNLLNLAVLLGYTILDMLVALLLTGFWIPTLWTAGILILALVSSAYYNYRIASFIERVRH
jgi:hypothetical protein